MAGVNKVILIGNLGIDPEVRTLESGVKVARLSVATSESYTNREGVKVEQTEWHSITLWRQLAEVAEKYLSKGNKVYIEGKLRTRSYTDKEGIEKYTTEIIADNMQMLGGSGSDSGARSENTSSGSQNTSQNPQSQPATEGKKTEADDLPF